MFNEVENYYDLNSPSKNGPRGFLFAYNEDGELLFTRENMIVESGRTKMMINGFDNNASKITKVILGSGNDMTTADMKNITGDYKYEIKNRLENVMLNENGHSYVTSEQLNNFNTIVMKDSSVFNSLTLDHKTGNIKYGESILIHSVSGKKRDNIIDIEGYDNSCFEIFHDHTNLKALVKIFVRKTFDDDDATRNDVNNRSLDKISELALFMEDEMFSRVVFPPYYKSSTQSILFNYYIYF